MRKWIFFSGLFFFCGLFPARSQGTNEKIIIQTDRDRYAPGETIYFKGFVIAETDTAGSTSLFVELWDDSLRKRAEIILPIVDGSTAGSISIPKELNSLQVLLRAYTEVSASQQFPFQFVKPVLYTAAIPGPGTGQPVFFPEGGKLVYNALNHVAFRAAEGFSGSVRNGMGETIATLSPAFSGIGSFSFTPEKGETYTCYGNEKGKESGFALPVPVETGIALHVKQSADSLFFDLDNGGSKDPVLQKLSVQLMISNEIAYLVELNMATRSTFSYFIPLSEFRAGMAEIRVLDANKEWLASRPVFLNRHSLPPGTEMKSITKDLGRRGENRIRIQFKDTTLRHVSVSITDAEYNEPGSVSGLIRSVSSPVDQPVSAIQYPISKPEELDLLIQTAGTGFPGTPPALVKSAPAPGKYLQLQGTVKRGKKLLAEKKILVGLRSAWSGKEIYKVFTDKKGNFVLDGLIVYGETFVHCRLPGNEKEELTCTFNLKQPAVSPAPEFFSSFREIARGMLAVQRDTSSTVRANWNAAEDTLVFAEKAITLSEVVLRSNSSLAARKRLEEVERKYIDATLLSGHHATAETLDVMNDPNTIRYFDLFSYIGANMNRVNLRFVNGNKELMYFGRGLHGETMITVFYIGNSKVERFMLDNISLDQVAAIKFIPYLEIEPGLPPALGVFLKKPGDQGYWEKDRFQAFEQKLTGYTLPKEYLEPDYSDTATRVEKDTRKTLYWNPYTPVEKGVAEIRFFNNDRTKKIRVVAEGIAMDGSIVVVETELE